MSNHSSETDIDLPLVSIGMPVYNEAEFIEKSLRSILAQDYPSLEIIISDNGSMDATAEICQRIAGEDPRVIFHRYAVNQGVNANFHYVFHKARGAFFMWASGHDLWERDVISKCVESLQANPAAVLAFATPEWIDREGNSLGVRTGWTDTRGLGVCGRFMTVLWGSMNPLLGLIRVSCMPDLERSYTRAGADLVMLLEMVLKGDFIHVPGTKWWRRDFRGNEKYAEKLKRFGGSGFKISNSVLSRLFPLFGLPFAVFGVVFKARIGILSKFAIAFMLLTALPVRYVTGKYARN